MTISKVTTTGIKQLQKKLKTVADGVKDTKTMHKKSVVMLDGWVQKNFKTEGAESGKKWRPLAKSALDARRKGRKKSNSTKILQDTGALKGRWDLISNKDFGLLKSRVNYSVTHELGKGRIPKRKILPTEKQANKLVKPIIDTYTEDLIK